MTPTEEIAALEAEKAGYILTDKVDRVAEVEAEIDRLSALADAEPPAPPETTVAEPAEEVAVEPAPETIVAEAPIETTVA